MPTDPADAELNEEFRSIFFPEDWIPPRALPGLDPVTDAPHLEDAG